MAVDVELLDYFQIVEANDPPQSAKGLRGETPVNEVITGVNVARLVNLDRRGVGSQARPVGLEHDFTTRSEHVRERAQQRDWVGHAVQDSEAQHDVEALVKLAPIQRVHAAVLDQGS